MTDRPQVWPYPGKRVIDVAVLALAAIPTAIIGAVCAAAILITSGRPVIFRQERIGWRGRPFTLLKFRTMINCPDGNPIIPEPSHITPIGRLLRRFSLDELPQLINVARGDMSIVGPRPTLESQYRRYNERQRLRQAVRPGLTGMAQVHGRSAIVWADRIELDLAYIENQSPILDLRILLQSVSTVVRGSGVDANPIDDPLTRPNE